MAVLKIRDAEGNVREILAIRGENYLLTEEDKQEIAAMAAEMIKTEIPSGDGESY